MWPEYRISLLSTIDDDSSVMNMCCSHRTNAYVHGASMAYTATHTLGRLFIRTRWYDETTKTKELKYIKNLNILTETLIFLDHSHVYIKCEPLCWHIMGLPNHCRM